MNLTYYTALIVAAQYIIRLWAPIVGKYRRAVTPITSRLDYWTQTRDKARKQWKHTCMVLMALQDVPKWPMWPHNASWWLGYIWTSSQGSIGVKQKLFLCQWNTVSQKSNAQHDIIHSPIDNSWTTARIIIYTGSFCSHCSILCSLISLPWIKWMVKMLWSEDWKTHCAFLFWFSPFSQDFVHSDTKW